MSHFIKPIIKVLVEWRKPKWFPVDLIVPRKARVEVPTTSSTLGLFVITFRVTSMRMFVEEGTFFDCTALGPTVILRALMCLDKLPETGGFSRVLGIVGIISIFMYWVTVIN